MSIACPPLGPRSLPRRPWAKLTDVEYAAIRVWLPGGDDDAESPATRGRRGRPPQDLRRTLDAIFWIACSREPWRNLPADLGNGESAARMLRRWARAGVLEPLLIKCSHPDAQGCDALTGLAYWLCRAFRRMARILSTAALALVRDVLHLMDAWPAVPLILPNRNLSESARAAVALNAERVQAHGRAVRAADRPGEEPSFRASANDLRGVIRQARALWNVVRLGTSGNRSAWRLK